MVERTKVGSQPKIVAVDIFCGLGGLSLGLTQSGISVGAGIDVDPACRYPFERNIGARFINQDVSKLDLTGIRSSFGNANITVLAGCAPCQPFSGYTSRLRNTDQRWKLLIEFLRITGVMKPDIVTLENVPRLPSYRFGRSAKRLS